LLSRTLTVGGNNLDTTFSGRIESATSIGMLVKVGTGTLTLTNANTYSGGTIIHRGKVLVNNTTGSGTGQGPVFVLGGRLGGIGTVKEVEVGDGSGPGAFLSAGKKASNPGTLTIKNSLFFGSDATYRVHVNSTTGKADKVAARSVAIGRQRQAQFSFSDIGNGTLPVGTVFTVIENTSSRPPIAGTFTNLADGAVFTSKNNTYQVDYQGGTGNDLTLTVVP
jgi:autotransporter-associated beta strand protein